jgi:hypothetical protein
LNEIQQMLWKEQKLWARKNYYIKSFPEK